MYSTLHKTTLLSFFTDTKMKIQMIIQICTYPDISTLIVVVVLTDWGSHGDCWNSIVAVDHPAAVTTYKYAAVNAFIIQ